MSKKVAPVTTSCAPDQVQRMADSHPCLLEIFAIAIDAAQNAGKNEHGHDARWHLAEARRCYDQGWPATAEKHCLRAIISATGYANKILARANKLAQEPMY